MGELIYIVYESQLVMGEIVWEDDLDPDNVAVALPDGRVVETRRSYHNEVNRSNG